MSDMVFAFHVCGPYMSGRAIKYKVLSDSDIRAAQSSIARSMQKNDTGFDFRAAERREGAMRMLTHVSKPNLQPADFLAAATGEETRIDWIPVSLQDLMMPTGEKSFATLFPFPRDAMMIEKIYSDLHELTLDEVTSISGKQVPVSLD